MQYARFLRGAEAVNSGPPAYAKSTLTQRAISAFTELLNSHPRPHWHGHTLSHLRFINKLVITCEFTFRV